MDYQDFYIVHGMGPDAVGLVGKITAPIAGIDGNILDLRQDVIHGLFTIYLVIDLTESKADFHALLKVIEDIGRDTGLSLTAEHYAPVARRPDKKNLLMILIGRDKPGIIAASSEMLGKYNANIEFSQTIGREGVFLMELLTDVSHADIPIDNLKKTLSKNMQALNIQTVFQEEDVFNKRKRVILFHMESSFLSPETVNELMEQAEIPADALRKLTDQSDPRQYLETAVAGIDGLPLDVIEKLLSAVTPTPGTVELIQTLKIMGYKIALASRGFAFFTERLKKILDIDHAYGTCFAEDDDARTVVGCLAPSATGDVDAVRNRLSAQESLDRDDIAVITDEGVDGTPGIRLNLDLNVWLDCLNGHVISRENLLGLIGCFGIFKP